MTSFRHLEFVALAVLLHGRIAAQDWDFKFVDTFDGVSASLDSGLNERLKSRQLHGPWAGTRWLGGDEPERPEPHLADDFSGGDAEGWTALSGALSVVDESLRVENGFAKVGDNEWGDYQLSLTFHTVVPGAEPWLHGYILFRFQDLDNYYLVGLHGDHTVELTRRSNGQTEGSIAVMSTDLDPSEAHRFDIVVVGETIRVTIDGHALMVHDDSGRGGPLTGAVGVWAWETSDARVDDLLVAPIVPLSEVDPNLADRLTLDRPNAGVELEEPIQAGSDRGYSLSYSTTPATGAWTSISLRDEFDPGRFIELRLDSEGSVTAIQNDVVLDVTMPLAPESQSYTVDVFAVGSRLRGTVNDIPIGAALSEALPATARLSLRASQPEGSHSSFDELIVRTPRESDRLRLYGYYHAEGPFGSHTEEVRHFTNFNILTDPEDLTEGNCGERGCALNVRWEFWGDDSGLLRPDWEVFWSDLLDRLRPKMPHVEAIYLVDEPFWGTGVQLDDYELVAERIHQDLPGVPVMTTFAYPTVDPGSNRPSCTTDEDRGDLSPIDGLDWVSFDVYPGLGGFWYVEFLLHQLQTIMPGRPTLLVPNSFKIPCADDDSEIAALNWAFYQLGLDNQWVTGFMNFGYWSFTQPEEVPLTFRVQELIGETILRKSRSRFLRADSNADGVVDLSDPIRTLTELFQPGELGEFPSCWKAIDANDDGEIDISDPVFTLLWLFKSESAGPATPFPECGPDLTDDSLSCDSFTPCR